MPQSLNTLKELNQFSAQYLPHIDPLGTLKLKHFDLLKDPHHLTLLEHAQNTQNQSVLNQIYELVLIKYTGKMSSTPNVQRVWNGRTLLHWAIECNQPAEVINDLIAKGAAINATDNQKNTPLIIAAKKGYLPIVQSLLQYRALNINCCNNRGATAIFYAADYGHHLIVQALLDKKARTDTSYYINSYTALGIAIKRQHHQVVHALLSAPNIQISRNLVTEAVKQGDYSIVKALLDKKAPLHYTINHNWGELPLHAAAQYGRVAIAKLLLERGAAINATTSGNTTALFDAVYSNQYEIVQLLLQEKNIDTDILSTYEIEYASAEETSDTPLSLAFKNKNWEICHAILSKKLTNYRQDTNARPNNDYKKSITFFGVRIATFGYSAKEKKEAAEILQEALANKSIDQLEQHRKVLNNGKLGVIYRHIKKYLQLLPSSTVQGSNSQIAP